MRNQILGIVCFGLASGKYSIQRHARHEQSLPETLYTQPLPLRPHDYAAEDVAEVNLPTEAPTYSGSTSAADVIELPLEQSHEIPHDLSDDQGSHACRKSRGSEARADRRRRHPEDAHEIGGVELDANGSQAETDELVEEITEILSADDAEEMDEADESDEADAAHEAAEHADAMAASATWKALIRNPATMRNPKTIRKNDRQSLGRTIESEIGRRQRISRECFGRIRPIRGRRRRKPATSSPEFSATQQRTSGRSLAPPALPASGSQR